MNTQGLGSRAGSPNVVVPVTDEPIPDNLQMALARLELKLSSKLADVNRLQTDMQMLQSQQNVADKHHKKTYVIACDTYNRVYGLEQTVNEIGTEVEKLQALVKPTQEGAGAVPDRAQPPAGVLPLQDAPHPVAPQAQPPVVPQVAPQGLAGALQAPPQVPVAPQGVAPPQVQTAHDQSALYPSVSPFLTGTPAGLAATVPFITTATSSAPIPEASGGLVSRLGAYAPGLEPAQTMLTAFTSVIDYRTYRLIDTSGVPSGEDLRRMYRLKKQVDGLNTTMGVFDGSDPMELLSFLATFKKAMDGLSKSEAVAVRVLAYFLADDAKDAYQSQMSPGALDQGTAFSMSWPYVVHMLIKRFLTDDVLQESYDGVTRAVQREGEDEINFAQRIMDAARLCRHVFSPAELVNHYVRGLTEATRERVQEQVRRMSFADRSKLVTVCQLAAAKGRAQRAEERARAASSKTKSTAVRSTTKQAHTKTMHIDVADAFSSPSTPSASATSGHDSAQVSKAHDPVAAVDAAANLQTIFVISSEQVTDALKDFDLGGRNLLRAKDEVPDLTAKQIQFALAVIPADYWQLSCWTCRALGHSTFTCPLLSLSQRIFFAYAYYLHHVKSNPALKEWFKQKLLAMKGEGEDPGPRPGGVGGGRQGGWGPRNGNGRQGGGSGYRPQASRVQVAPPVAQVAPATAGVKVLTAKSSDTDDASSSSGNE